MVTGRLASIASIFGARPRAPGPPRLSPGARVYAIGDVHGHLDRLLALHDAVRADLLARPVARPVLVHLGDLIDRGPESAGVLALLAQGDPVAGVPTVNLMGNHEWMALAAIARQDAASLDHWLDNGGLPTLASWGIRPSMPPARWTEAVPRTHLEFLRGLSGWYRRGAYVFAHAGVRPGRAMAEQVWTDLIWIREPFLDHHRSGRVLFPDAPEAVVVHGHTPEPEPSLHANRIGVDTGAGRGGPLTCAVLEGDDVRFLQVRADGTVIAP